MNAPIKDHPNTTDAKRDWWFDDLHSQAFAVKRYAETMQLLAEVRDMRGMRHSFEQLVVKVKLTRGALKALEELDAAERKTGVE